MLNSQVRLYEGEWFTEGKVVSVLDDIVIVDYCDWKQQYKLSELRTEYIFYVEVIIPTAPGTTIVDYR
jgi:hypothetical protein